MDGKHPPDSHAPTSRNNRAGRREEFSTVFLTVPWKSGAGDAGRGLSGIFGDKSHGLTRDHT